MKLLKSSIFWGLYAYILTILAQYGFNSYFGIPSNFIEPSIRDNIIFFFVIFKGLITLPTFWVIFFIMFIIFIAITFFEIFRNNLVIKTIIVLLGIFLIFVFYKFGEQLAKKSQTFPILSGNCLPLKDNIIYLVPAFYQTNAIVVPISSDDSHKIVGSFFLKEPIGPECGIHNEKIGQVTK